MSRSLSLVSHHLCPYVQRAVIALTEKNVPFTRVEVSLKDKPDWFVAISPLGKTPVLLVDNTAIFESAVILEYLEETLPNTLHPCDALQRAEHRSWMEVGSSILSDIAGFYSATDEAMFDEKSKVLKDKFVALEQRLAAKPYFDGRRFSLVDAVFGPVMRYFDVFDQIGDFGILTNRQKLADWRHALSARPSVRTAVAHDYEARLLRFLIERQSFLAGLLEGESIFRAADAGP